VRGLVGKKPLHLFVVRTLVERYKWVVDEKFDETDPQLLQGLFAEGEERPEPYLSFESEVEVSVDEDDNYPDL